MALIGVIPARWASTRFPGKILADIAGKPMLQHVWERAKQAKTLTDVIIACDEEHVFEKAKSFGAHAVLTRKDHVSGSDRVAEVALQTDAKGIVNIQGDEPLIEPKLIDDLADALQKEMGAVMTTAIKRIRTAEEFNNSNIVKVVVDRTWNALYFSRAAIPFHRDGKVEDYSRCFRHLGIYAYRRDFLLDYCSWPKSFLEQEESLEQLRVLEAGYKIKTVLTDYETIGVDTPQDLKKINDYFLRQQGK
ncbi:MAG: 3-deoxy-manno-octulosonate cytidylyltransferase [Candidatus Omnitrophica bacterium]|nr:3-deoxy-manno-octulosonate cytidylyltransferase [Candidatus Omnitrophota bacterium]